MTRPSNAVNFWSRYQGDLASFVRKKQISNESPSIDRAVHPACERVHVTVTDRTDCQKHWSGCWDAMPLDSQGDSKSRHQSRAWHNVMKLNHTGNQSCPWVNCHSPPCTSWCISIKWHNFPIFTWTYCTFLIKSPTYLLASVATCNSSITRRAKCLDFNLTRLSI